MNKVTWRQYEVDENETLMSISIKPGFIALLKTYGITRHTQREYISGIATSSEMFSWVIGNLETFLSLETLLIQFLMP